METNENIEETYKCKLAEAVSSFAQNSETEINDLMQIKLELGKINLSSALKLELNTDIYFTTFSALVDNELHITNTGNAILKKLSSFVEVDSDLKEYIDGYYVYGSNIETGIIEGVGHIDNTPLDLYQNERALLYNPCKLYQHISPKKKLIDEGSYTMTTQRVVFNGKTNNIERKLNDVSLVQLVNCESFEIFWKQTTKRYIFEFDIAYGSFTFYFLEQALKQYCNKSYTRIDRQILSLEP
jgi:hypothetical protein